MDIQAAGAIVSSIGTAMDLTKLMVDVRDASKLQTLKFDIQQALLEAQQFAISSQQEQLSLVGRVSAAEAELARLKEWKAQEGEYKLEEVPSSAFIYVSQPTGDTSKPEVWLCPKLLGKSSSWNPNIRRTLQRTRLERRMDVYNLRPDH